MSEITAVEENMLPIINKGAGAGGANTNKNGLSYEELTDLKDKYKSCKEYSVFKVVVFKGYKRKFVNVNKSALHKYMKIMCHMNKELLPAAGCKEPDEAYIDIENNIVFIIEKKFQQTGGSVDEKIQTGHFKKLHYGKLFPNFKIYYTYCLSDWFKQEDYKSTLDYLKENGIPIFWGSSETFKEDMIKFIHNSL
jgi:hypothetical protein